MTKEVARQIKNMGEKVTVSATRYTVTATRLNYDTFQPENFTTTITSRKNDLTREELANKLYLDPRAIRDIRQTSGTVIISLDGMLEHGLFITSEESEIDE